MISIDIHEQDLKM